MRSILVKSSVFLIALTFALGASAESPSNADSGSGVKQCGELLRKCFPISNIEGSNCLYSTAKDPACEDNELGKLATKRWNALRTAPVDELDQAPALLGPSSVNTKACVSRFDHDFEASLKSPELSEESVVSLNSKLASCEHDMSVDIPRS